MYVTVIGGGNSTAIFATLAKKAGHEVAILTRKPEAWSKTVGFANEDKEYLDGEENFEAEVDLITKDPAECIPQSDLIFIAGVPIHHNPAILKDTVAPHLNREKQVFVGSICAYGGFNWVCADALGKGNYIIFGTQLIPWCCGTKEYGKTGVVFGAKRMLRVATEDGKDEHGVKKILQDILKIPDVRDTDFLASTLWPNNSSLHPPILYGLFKDWDGKTGYDKESLPVRIYAELTDESAQALADFDDELCAIVDALKVHYPDNKHLHEDYRLRSCIIENYKDQVGDSSTLKSTVKTTKAFGSHNIPYQTLEDGKIVPIIAHKFFETDLSFGVTTFIDIANMLGVEVPTMKAIARWNQKLINKDYITDSDKIDGKDAGECILPSAYGLDEKSLDKGRR
mmetsp:Transcript_18620/g.36488  ORF Transcript_18620/g.36488 Transcript_18620/m.36488 type:complete len:397 (+) Transcript_18620:129-1319(+)